MGQEHRATLVRRLSRASRVGMVLSGLLVTALVAVLPALADTPETGNSPGVTLTVTPSDGLIDGQVVSVTGTGFPPNTLAGANSRAASFSGCAMAWAEKALARSTATNKGLRSGLVLRRRRGMIETPRAQLSTCSILVHDGNASWRRRIYH